MDLITLAMAKKAGGGGGGGGSSLPAVTSDDNGDLLGVVEGAWAKVEPTTGGETFTVTLTKEDDIWTADKTIAEIVTAHAAGKNCVAVGDYLGAGFTIAVPLTVSFNGDEVFAVFSGVLGIENEYFNIAVSGTVNFEADSWLVETAVSLPPVTSSDNGSLLGVSDGAWAKVTSTAPMVVTGTIDGTSVTITTALADIKAAFDAGRTVYLSSMGVHFPLVFCEEESSAITLVFTTLAYDTDDNDFSSYAVVFDNSTTGTLAIK